MKSANLCEIVGANITMIRKGIGSDSRIGDKFLYAGVGYGGSCFPKDVKVLIRTAEQNGYSMRIIKAVEAVNNDQKNVFFNKFLNYFKNNVKGIRVAIWGLAFKPLTDDIRESPSLEIIKLLLKAGCKVRAYDPVALKETNERFGVSIEYASDPYDALVNADCLILMTEWNEFRLPDWNRIQDLLNHPVVFDGRNLYDANEIKSYGFDYFGIGI